MCKARITALLGTVAVLAVTACAGNAHPAAGNTHSAAASAHPANNTTSSSTGATCSQARGIIQSLANAQAVYNASQQTEHDALIYIIELDQAIAIIHGGGPISAKPRWSSTGSGQLNQDLYQFYDDASAFTQGDVSMTSSVSSDIGALATDCGTSATSSGQ